MDPKPTARRGRPRTPEARRPLCIMLRCPRELAEQFRKRAALMQLPLASWIRMTCAEALEKQKAS